MNVDKSEKMFPLQTDSHAPAGPTQIPWSVAEIAYGEYARRYGKSQSLQRLAERGGFGWGEMDEFHPKWREEVSEIAELRAVRALLLAEHERLLEGARAAYWHLDTYGIVKGDDRQIESQKKVFELLKPFFPPIPGRL